MTLQAVRCLYLHEGLLGHFGSRRVRAARFVPVDCLEEEGAVCLGLGLYHLAHHDRFFDHIYPVQGVHTYLHLGK